MCATLTSNWTIKGVRNSDDTVTQKKGMMSPSEGIQTLRPGHPNMPAMHQQFNLVHLFRIYLPSMVQILVITSLKIQMTRISSINYQIVLSVIIANQNRHCSCIHDNDYPCAQTKTNLPYLKVTISPITVDMPLDYLLIYKLHSYLSPLGK